MAVHKSYDTEDDLWHTLHETEWILLNDTDDGGMKATVASMLPLQEVLLAIVENRKILAPREINVQALR